MILFFDNIVFHTLVLLLVIHCPELVDVENATRNTNDTEYDTIVYYSCDPGYQFPDKDRVKYVRCSENETWTEFPPGCEGEWVDVVGTIDWLLSGMGEECGSE